MTEKETKEAAGSVAGGLILLGAGLKAMLILAFALGVLIAAF